MRITTKRAHQVHYVPDRITEPQGPFPRELFEESEIIVEDRKSTRLNSSHSQQSRMPSSA